MASLPALICDGKTLRGSAVEGEDGKQRSVAQVSVYARINTGSGDDTVDALVGGFRGKGTTNLGAGNDNLKGFGSGTFNGGNDVDTLTFNPGTYAIEDKGGGTYLIGGVMNVSGIESFGAGADQTDFLAAAAAGSVTFV